LLKIGDVVVITKEAERAGAFFALLSEGVLHPSVLVQQFETWLPEAELALFRVELPLDALSAPQTKLERKASKMSRLKSLGTEVKFGQHFLLRHVHSDRVLSLTHLEAAQTPGTFQVLLSRPREAVIFDLSLQPINKLQKPGEPVRYQDRLQLQFHFGSVKYNLNCAKTNQRFEVHGSHLVTPWTFSKYEEFTLNVESLRTESPFLIQLKRFSLHVTPKSSRKPADSGDEDPADAYLITDKDDYGGFWIAEKSKPLCGGPILFDETVYLRNLRSGLYLVEDLKLASRPEPEFTFFFPKPDSFVGSSEIPFNYPVLLKVSGNRTFSPNNSVHKEEIMSKVLPAGLRGDLTEEVVVETSLTLRDAITEEKLDALFELIPIGPVESQFMMQVSKLVPKFYEFREKVMERKDALMADMEPIPWDFAEDIEGVEGAMLGCLAELKAGHSPDTYEALQSTVVGLNMHKVLISIATGIFTTHRKAPDALEQDRKYREKSLHLFCKIWEFLIEVVGDNYYVSYQLEKFKNEICEMVVLEKHLIGSLLTEVYRIVDPEMPDFEEEFKKWCDRLEPVSTENLQEQTVFLRLIRCLCEVGETVKPEYQRVLVSYLFKDDGFPMIKVKTVQGQCFVHFWQKKHSLDEFLKANPALKPEESLLKETGKAYIRLETLSTEPVYVEYLYTALSLINTLSKGKLVEGKQYARDEIGLSPNLVISLIQKHGIPVKIKEACLLLIDTLVVSCPPFLSSTETKGSDFCFSHEDVLNSGREENYDNPIDFGDGQHAHVRFCLKLTLTLLLSKTLPHELQKLEPRELLEFSKALLQLCYSLVDCEHCSGLYVRSLDKALAFFLVALSDESSEKMVKRHWAVAPLKRIQMEAERDLVLRVQLNELLKLLISLLGLINQYLKRTKILNILRVCVTENEDFPQVSDIIDPQASEKILRKMLESRGPDGALSEGLLRSSTKQVSRVFNRGILLHGPSTKDYLFRVLLNWNSINSGLKESLIVLVKQLFAESTMTRRTLKNVDIITSEEFITMKRSLQLLKTENDLTRLLADAKYELHHMTSFTAFEKLNSILETITAALSSQTGMTNDQHLKAQNVMRHLDLHSFVMQTWNLVMVAARLNRSDIRQMRDLKMFLTVFLLNFVRGNEKNRNTIRGLFQPNFYFMTVPQFADLIRELTDFDSLGTADTTRFFAYILDTFHEQNLGAFNFIKRAIISRTGTLKPEKQNIAGRLVAERFHQHVEGRSQLRAELLEILALASIENGPIIAQCRQLLPPSELERMFINSEEPEVHHSLLMYLRYVYLSPMADIREYSDEVRVLRMLQCSLKLLTPIFKGSLSIYPCAVKGLYEQVFPKDQPLKVEKKKVKGSWSDTSNLLYMLSSGNRWSAAGGFLVEVPAMLQGLGLHSEKVNDFMASLKEQLVKFSELLLKEKTQYQELDFELLISSLHRSLQTLDSIAAEQARSLSGISTVLASLRLGTLHIVDTETVFDRRFHKQRHHVEKQMKAIGDSLYESLASSYNAVAYRTNVSLAKLPREELNRMIKMLRRVKRLFSGTRHRSMYFSFLQSLVPVEPLRKQLTSQVFLGAEVMEEAVDTLIKSESYAELNAALGFLIAQMGAQTKLFQDRFQEMIDRGEKSYYLFFRIKRELQLARLSLPGQTQHGLKQLTPEDPEDQQVMSERHKFLIRALTFLQLCCDNCNPDFQNYMRNQQKEEGRADVDLVTEVALLLTDMRDHMTAILADKTFTKIMGKALAALIDFVTGPCFENQMLLGNNVQVFLTINSLLAATQLDLTERASKVHNKAIILLHTLLEGEPDPSILQTMVRFLDLAQMREGIETFHRQHVVGREDAFAQELPSVEEKEMSKLKTNIMQAIFLLKVQKTHSTHPELKGFGQPNLDLQQSIPFYLSYIGYVEIAKAGVIYEHFFPVPFKCKFLTIASREEMLLEVDRRSHQKKIEDFLSRVEKYMKEMVHQQQLCSHPSLKQFTTLWKLYAQVSFLLVLAINLQLLFTYEGSMEKSIEEHPVQVVIMTVMGIMQLLTYMVSFGFYMFEYFPTIFFKTVGFKDYEIDQYNFFHSNESLYLKDVYRGHKLEHSGSSESFINSFRQMGNNMSLYYNYFYFLISVMALYFPLFNPVLLLDLIKQNQELVNVLKSITVNARQLLLTGCLGFILVFLFSLYSFIEYQDYYFKESGLYCNNMLDCFTSTINIGIRAGGLGGEGDIEEKDYYGRLLYDMLFYLIIIIILLNIIFGIIIDTFAQLRDRKNAVMLNINNVCYVCGKERGEIEQRGRGWTYHFLCEHSPFAYLAFLIYIKEMPIVDCAGIEKYTKEKLEKKDSSFMPMSSKLLQLRLSGAREEDD